MIKSVRFIGLILLFFSCSIMAPIDQGVSLNINLTNSRTIKPDTPTLTDYSIKLGNNPEVKFSTTNHTLHDITPGNYDITVNGYIGTDLVAQKNIPNKEIISGANSLDVELEYIQADTGSMDVKLNWSYTGVNGFTAVVKNLNSGEIIDLDINATTTVVFNKSSDISITGTIPSGNYQLGINLTDGTEVILNYTSVLQIYQNLKSEKNQIISDSDFNKPPGTPDNLVASEHLSGYRLDWRDNSFTETDYIVQRKDNEADKWEDIHTIATLFPNSVSYLDSDTNPANEYYYRVGAKNQYGVSYSDSVKTSDTTRPEVGQISMVSGTSSSVRLKWDAGSDNKTPVSELLYELYYSDVETTPELIKKNGVKVFTPKKNYLEHNVTGLTTGVTYNFTVAVYDLSSNSSNYATYSVKIKSDMNPPKKPVLQRSDWWSTTNNQISLGWTGAKRSRDTYKLYYAKSNLGVENLEQDIYLKAEKSAADIKSNNLVNVLISGLPAGTEYTFLVIATDKNGNKSYSDLYRDSTTGTSTEDTIPPTPGTLSVVTTGYNIDPVSNYYDFYIDLSWSQAIDSGTYSSSQDKLSYKVYYSDTYTVSEDIVLYGYVYKYSVSGNSANTPLECRINNLLYGTRYYLVVEVSDEAGNTSYYNLVSEVTPIPTNLPDIRIKLVTPGEKAIHVDLDQEVMIYFYDRLSEASVNNLTVYANRVEVDESWNVVSTYADSVDGTLTYDDSIRAIKFVPYQTNNLYDGSGNIVRKVRFKENSTYQLVIENVNNAGGEPISYQFCFKTLDYQVFQSHWKFDGDTLDYSGKERHITELTTNSYSTEEKKEGSSSIYLDGSDRGKMTNLSLGDKFTVTTWVHMPLSMKPSLNTIISNADSPESNNGFKLCVNTWNENDQTITVELGNGTTGAKFYTGEGFVKGGGWYHLAFVIDKTQTAMKDKIKLYFDGSEPLWPDGSTGVRFKSQDNSGDRTYQEFVDGGGWNFKTSGPYYFGSFPTHNSYGFEGNIDDMRIYNKALTEEEIKQIATQNY